DQSKWDDLIQTIQHQYNQGIYRLKVMLEENGELEYVVAPLSSKSQFTATIVPEHNGSSHLTKINKTSNRNHVTYRLD
ncbi:aminodeoxychorismate lyase, partial [Staphylococcus warneri]